MTTLSEDDANDDQVVIVPAVNPSDTADTDLPDRSVVQAAVSATVDASTVLSGGVDDSITVVSGGSDGQIGSSVVTGSGLTPLSRTVASFIDDGAEAGLSNPSSGGNDTITIDGGPSGSDFIPIPGDGNDSITVFSSGGDVQSGSPFVTGSGLAPFSTSAVPFIDDGAEADVGSTLSSGGNDTITIDGGGVSVTAGSVDDFIPITGGVSNPIDGGNDTITIGSTFGSNDALSVTVGDDGIREAPLIIVDRPIDLGGGPLPPPMPDPDDIDIGLAPVRIGAPQPPVLDPDDLFDLELGTVEISLPPGPPKLPGVDAPPPVLDNGLTMIAQAAPATGDDDAVAIIAATA
jgi:hypothetical protein